MNSDALIAVKGGNLEKLKELLKQGININAQDDNGRTLLHHAASNYQNLVVRYLLQNGANILITTHQSYTALHIAISSTGVNYPYVLEAIFENVTRKELRKLLDMKIKDSGNTALHISCKKQDIESSHMDTSFLLYYGANFEIRNDAGEKPVDVASNKLTRGLFKLIETSFAKAKNGNDQLISDLKESLFGDHNAVMNCQNNEGRTIMQVLLMNQHYKLSQDLLWLRTIKALPQFGFERIYSRDRITEIEKLAEKIEEHLELSSNCSGAMRGFVDNTVVNLINNQPKKFSTDILKICCHLLEKAHEVLLAYRKFSAEKTLTASVPMKIIEEVLELLNFDPDEPFVIVDEEPCYYKNQPIQWKKNYKPFMFLAEGIVRASIAYFSQFLNNIRLIHAVIDDDVDKVKKLLHMDLCSIELSDQHNDRTALCYAAEKGNENIIHLLLQAGAKVVQDEGVSPVYLAAKKGHTKVVKMLLDNVNTKDMPKLLDCQQDVKCTALHAAAKKGHLDVIKILLGHGATYLICDRKGRTPMDVSVRNKDVSAFFKIVDECFHDAKEGNIDLIRKLKVMEHDEFMAVVNAKNLEGLTIAIAAAKANAKSIAVIIFRMIKEAKQETE